MRIAWLQVLMGAAIGAWVVLTYDTAAVWTMEFFGDVQGWVESQRP